MCSTHPCKSWLGATVKPAAPTWCTTQEFGCSRTLRGLCSMRLPTIRSIPIPRSPSFWPRGWWDLNQTPNNPPGSPLYLRFSAYFRAPDSSWAYSHWWWRPAGATASASAFYLFLARWWWPPAYATASASAFYLFLARFVVAPGLCNRFS